MRQTVVMQKLDSHAEFVSHLSDLFDGIGLVIVVLEEVKDAGAKHFKGYANVAVVVKPVQHLHTSVFAPWIIFGKLFQDVNLKLGRFPILFDILYDLEGSHFVFENVLHFDDFAESAFAEGGEDLEPILQHVAGRVDEVAFGIVLNDGRTGLGRRR